MVSNIYSTERKAMSSMIGGITYSSNQDTLPTATPLTKRKYSVKNFEKRMFLDTISLKPVIFAKQISSNSIVASFCDGSLALYDISSHKCTHIFKERHIDWPSSICNLDTIFYVTGIYFFYFVFFIFVFFVKSKGCYGGMIKIWDFNQKTQLNSFSSIHKQAITSIKSFSKNEFLSSSFDSTVNIWDTREFPNNQYENKINFGSPVLSVDISNDMVNHISFIFFFFYFYFLLIFLFLDCRRMCRWKYRGI
jgi:WD40 repeat protein